MKEQQHQELVQSQQGNRSGTALLELIDRSLDKGVMIEGWARVPVLGIEVLTLDFGAFVASCEKYLEYAEAVEQTAQAVEQQVVEVDDDG